MESLHLLYTPLNFSFGLGEESLLPKKLEQASPPHTDPVQHLKGTKQTVAGVHLHIIHFRSSIYCCESEVGHEAWMICECKTLQMKGKCHSFNHSFSMLRTEVLRAAAHSELALFASVHLLLDPSPRLFAAGLTRPSNFQVFFCTFYKSSFSLRFPTAFESGAKALVCVCVYVFFLFCFVFLCLLWTASYVFWG